MRKYSSENPRLVAGIGINDVPNQAAHMINGNRKITSCYRQWTYILRKCKTRGDSICDDWKTFSKFKEYFDSICKDKDRNFTCINVDNKKHWSPETCYMLTTHQLRFLAASVKHKPNRNNKFSVFICDLEQEKYIYLGEYLTKEESLSVWKKKKHEFSLILASKETDFRVKKLLETMYL